MQEKQRLRALVAEERKRLSEAALEEMSADVTAQLLRLPEYRGAEIVFAYRELPGEVRLSRFLKQCRAEGRRTALPRVEGRRMRFYEVTETTPLREGAMHIWEPDPDLSRCVDDEEQAFMVLPGVAFDPARHRIGYGGGFYDRYLAEHRRHPTAAVAFAFQVFETVPFAETDIRPDRLLIGGTAEHSARESLL